MSSLPNPYLTPEEYLALDRQAEHKSEYHAGEMLAVHPSGADHHRVCTNLLGQLSRQLRHKAPSVSAGSVRIGAGRLFAYPDFVIVACEPQFSDAHRDTVTNPSIIIEVLSDASERADRGEKWHHYQQVASLQEYVLVSHYAPQIERFRRVTGRDGWIYTASTRLNSVVELTSVGCRLALVDVYDRITFVPGADGPPRRETR